MKEGILNYWHSLWTDIPLWFYEASSSVLCIVAVLCVSIWGFRRGLRQCLGVLLIEYILLIYGSTVFFRVARKTLAYDLIPFWSYRAYLDGREPNALIENLMNVVVFVPIGLLVGMTLRTSSWLKVFGIGLSLSIGIEVLQIMFKRGFSEVDDVMHNTLGCLIGYGIWLIMRRLWNCSMRCCR